MQLREQTNPPSALPWSWARLMYPAALLILVVAGASVRFVNFSSWPDRFFPMLQYESAIGARQIWLNMQPEFVDEAKAQWLAETPRGFQAPPLLQGLVAFGYCIGGDELPWLATLWNTLFWLTGAIFLAETIRRVTDSSAAAVIGVVPFIFLPLCIYLSRSFQVEATMVCLMNATIWLTVCWQDTPTWRHTLLLALVAALASLAKPGFAFFPLFGAYLGTAWSKRGSRTALLSPHTWAFAGLSLAPSLIYAFFFLQGHAERKIIPGLLGDTHFYFMWWIQTSSSVGVVLLLVGVAGCLLLAMKGKNLLGLGLLAGYLAFSLLFTWQTMTHQYYQAMLVPVLALGLGCITSEALKKPIEIKVSYVGLLLVLSFFVLLQPARKLLAEFSESEARLSQQQVIEAKLQETLPVGARVLCLDRSTYGYRFRYNCWLITRSWPSRLDLDHEKTRNIEPITAQERLDHFKEKLSPSFFLVVGKDELTQQPELESLLKPRPVVFREGAIVVYDLR